MKSRSVRGIGVLLVTSVCVLGITGCQAAKNQQVDETVSEITTGAEKPEATIEDFDKVETITKWVSGLWI